MLALWLPLSAHGQGAAFSCDGTFYQMRQVGRTSELFRVNRNSTPYTTTSIRKLDFLLNCLAYNPNDGYLYGVEYVPDGTTAPGTLNMYKIGQGGVVDLGEITNVPRIQFAGGVIDRNGRYYISPQGTNSGVPGNTDYNDNLYYFDLTRTGSAQRTATRLALQNRQSPSLFFDLAINPLDQQLYGVQALGVLYKITPNLLANTANVTTIQSNMVRPDELLGTAFFDPAGYFFVYSNGDISEANSGGFYQVNVANAQWIKLNNINPAAISDGASCIYPDQRIDVLKTAGTVTAVTATTFDVPYSIQVKNTGTISDPMVQVSEFLTGTGTNATGTAFPSAASVEVLNLNVTNANGATLAKNPNFTGFNTGAGMATSLLDGKNHLTAGQSATITFTARVRYASLSAVPTSVQNNSVYVSTVSLAPSNINLGHTLRSGTVVPPSELLDADQSTNASLFPLIGKNDEASPTPITFPATISGTVFEDVNYGGGAGRSLAASSGVGRPNALVELYSANGTLVDTARTNSKGLYSFLNKANGIYTVRVVNALVSSSRLGYVGLLLPVQTYVKGNTSAVGGVAPNKQDLGPNNYTGTNFANATRLPLFQTQTEGYTTQSTASVTLQSGTSVAEVDFGFNFDLIVNTNDAGQGSLRQFVANASALGDEAKLAQAGSTRSPLDASAQPLPQGVETSIFMISTGQLTAQNSQRVAVINLASTLLLTGANAPLTVLDGGTQTANMGNTNNATLGTGTVVGTVGSQLNRLNGPEVQLQGNRSQNGITVAVSNLTIRGLSLTGFQTNIYALLPTSGNYTNLRVERNVLGTVATSFTDPGAGRTSSAGINLNGLDNSTVQDNLIGFNGGMGVWVYGGNMNDGRPNGANNNFIADNEIRGNGQEAKTNDGLELQGVSTDNTVQDNLITQNFGHGIDSNTNSGGNAIRNNTISGNGLGVAAGNVPDAEGSGIRMYGLGQTVSGNVLTANNGSGVLVAATASNVVITQNSTFSNTRLGIDLLSNADSPANGNTGAASNVTLNANNKTATTGGNSLLNFPVFTQATIDNGTLVVTGYVTTGAKVELFVAERDASGFGEGQTYFALRTEGAADDNDGARGSYADRVIGVSPGTETNQSRFLFRVLLSSVPQAARAQIVAGARLTATATLTSVGTSEFAGQISIASGPLPVELTAFTATAKGNHVVLNWATASEKNNDHFTVERSADGQTFVVVGTVAGQGTTTVAHTYSTTDANAANLASTLYYRLRQVDTDGTESLSPVRTVAFARPAEASLYPNPATTTTSLDLRALPAGSYTVTLLDLAGHTVATHHLGSDLLPALDLSALPRGAYLVRVQGAGTNLTKRLVKE